jgi:hypothetical protein
LSEIPLTEQEEFFFWLVPLFAARWASWMLFTPGWGCWLGLSRDSSVTLKPRFRRPTVGFWVKPTDTESVSIRSTDIWPTFETCSVAVAGSENPSFFAPRRDVSKSASLPGVLASRRTLFAEREDPGMPVLPLLLLLLAMLRAFSISVSVNPQKGTSSSSSFSMPAELISLFASRGFLPRFLGKEGRRGAEGSLPPAFSALGLDISDFAGALGCTESAGFSDNWEFSGVTLCKVSSDNKLCFDGEFTAIMVGT